VDEPGAQVFFHDAEGTLLERGVGPIERFVPPGGWVTVSSGLLRSFVGVPNGNTLRFRPNVSEGSPAAQSIRITLPAQPEPDWPEFRTPSISVGAAFGCGSTVGEYGETYTIPLAEACLVDGKAQLYIRTARNAANGYNIHVADIEVGAASEPPREVALPGWEPFDPLQIDLEDVPAGREVRMGAASLYGDTRMYSQVADRAPEPSVGTATTTVAAPPALGDRWRLFVESFDPSGTPGVCSRASACQLWVFDPGYPLTAGTFSLAAMLPLPSIATDGPRAVTLSSSPMADRIVLWLTGEEGRWQIVAPPGTTSLSLPSGEPELDAFGTIVSGTLYVEDLEPVSGYGEVFDGSRNPTYPERSDSYVGMRQSHQDF
jgi:hypothetical protein